MNIQTRPDPVARARELGVEIAAAADEIERTRRIPEAVLGRLHDARLFRMLLPRSAGGDETEPAVYVAAVEELARHDASIAWNAFVANSSALIAAYLEPAVNHAIFADPRSIVAWGPPNASRATAVDIGYRLTGKWDFASGCRHARWMGAHCLVLEADDTLRLNRFGRPTVRTLLFPASEATLLDTWRTIGLCGTASDSYCVNDVFVSEAFSTTREDPTLRRERGPLYAFTMQGLYATGVAAVALGIARAMLSELITLASRKAPRGLARLADNAVVQADVARAEARLGSRLPHRDAHHDLCAGRRRGADRCRRSGPRAARLRQRDPWRGRGGRLRLQGSGRRCDLPGQPVRAPASATCTRFLSRSRHAPPISNRSGGSCSACRPRSFFRA